MNKRILWIFAVAVTVFALSFNVFAQPPGPGGGRGQGMGPGGGMGMAGGAGGFGMLQNPEFAKMLELTPEQTTSLQTAIREAGEKFREEMRSQQGAAPPTPEQMRERMEKFFDGMQVEVNKVLKPAQQTKARELTFQMTGGLISPVMGIRTLETLELTDAQKEQVRKIMNDRDAENRAAMQGFDFRNASQEEQEKMRAGMEERGKKYAEQIKAILTPEQQAKAERLTTEAPALREKLGIPAPGQRGAQQGQRGRQGQQGPTYTPGADSWQPGRPVPNASPAQDGRRPGNFPRRGE
jgi:Spy/CpxP family protein refolding chaperone